MELENKIRFPKGIEIQNFTSLLWVMIRKLLRILWIVLVNFIIFLDLISLSDQKTNHFFRMNKVDRKRIQTIYKVIVWFFYKLMKISCSEILRLNTLKLLHIM